MRSLISKFLGTNGTSKEDAKQRLKVLLIHDQVDLTAGQLEQMKQEIMEVVARYVEVDTEAMDLHLSKGESGIQLVSSLPVRRVTARAS